eukprot:973238-Prorocentrum_minimum.AAC.1
MRVDQSGDGPRACPIRSTGVQCRTAKGPLRLHRGSAGGPQGVRRGSAGGPQGLHRGSAGGPQGIYRSGVDARKPQNPTKSEEYQRRLQGVLYIV